MVAPLSQRAYAKLRGVSHVAVNRAIKAGRLRESVNERGQITNPDLADREWEANTDHSTSPAAVVEAESQRQGAAPLPPPDGEGPETMTMVEANRRERVWKAKTAELKYREAAGELIPASKLRATVTNAFASCRTKLLGVPGRAKQALPHLTVADLAVLEGLVREALEDLAS